jgi:hypothetical protein
MIQKNIIVRAISFEKYCSFQAVHIMLRDKKRSLILDTPEHVE